MCQNTPNLQSLTIVGGIEGTDAHVLPSNFLENAPLLNSLEFKSVLLSKIPTCFLPKLTRIKWLNWTEVTPVRLEDLLELFKSSPLVEVIEIYASVQKFAGDPLKKVTLNNLRQLEWTDKTGSNSLMPYIIAPRLSQLTIEVSGHSIFQQQPTMPLSILPPDPVYIPLLSEPTRAVYHLINHQQCSFGYPTDHHHLSLKFRGIPDGDRFLHLVHPISISKVQELEVEFYDRSPVDFPIGKFEHLQKICLKPSVYARTLGLTRILEPRPCEPIPCTMLSEIRLSGIAYDCRRALNELTNVLWRRKEAGHMVKTVYISTIHNGLYPKDPHEDIEALREVVDEVFLE